MSIETKRIYKITEDNFYVITQGTRVIVDDEGNITGHVQSPVATIGYGYRLLVVEPHQVEFIEEQKQTMSDKIIDYSMGFENESMVCSFVKGDEGNKTLNITWKEEE